VYVYIYRKKTNLKNIIAIWQQNVAVLQLKKKQPQVSFDSFIDFGRKAHKTWLAHI